MKRLALLAAENAASRFLSLSVVQTSNTNTK